MPGWAWLLIIALCGSAVLLLFAYYLLGGFGRWWDE